MVKKLAQVILILLIVFLLISCSSRFDKNMKDGKNYMLKKDYDTAFKSFDAALIDKPSDKDAQLLYSEAKSKVDKISLDKKYKTYIDENSENFKAYLNLVSTGKGAPDENTDFKVYVEKLKKVLSDSDSVRLSWLNEKEITDLHKIFMDSINYKIKSIQAYIDLFENEEKKTGSGIFSKYNSNSIKEFGDKSKEELEKYAANIKKVRNNMESK